MAAMKWRHDDPSPSPDSPSPDRRNPNHGGETAGIDRRTMMALTALGLLGANAVAAPANTTGRLVWATHISLAPTWFDPAETGGVVTPFMMLYALHDGLAKPMPGNPAALCLASAYTASADGLRHEFLLRDGAMFHNGEAVTADDVKFSFDRYRGNAARFLKENAIAAGIGFLAGMAGRRH